MDVKLSKHGMTPQLLGIITDKVILSILNWGSVIKGVLKVLNSIMEKNRFWNQKLEFVDFIFVSSSKRLENWAEVI